MSYGDFVTIQRDEGGAITALTTDMARMNLLRAELTAAILKALEGADVSEIQVPLGSLFDLEPLWAKGPALRARAMTVGTVRTEFESQFTSAGGESGDGAPLIPLNGDKISVAHMTGGQISGYGVFHHLSHNILGLCGGNFFHNRPQPGLQQSDAGPSHRQSHRQSDQGWRDIQFGSQSCALPKPAWTAHVSD